MHLQARSSRKVPVALAVCAASAALPDAQRRRAGGHLVTGAPGGGGCRAASRGGGHDGRVHLCGARPRHVCQHDRQPPCGVPPPPPCVPGRRGGITSPVAAAAVVARLGVDPQCCADWSMSMLWLRNRELCLQAGVGGAGLHDFPSFDNCHHDLTNLPESCISAQ